ncbi:MAG: ABC-2 family transporter protein, partial [Candidatus Acidiferrales bacterium]
AWLPFEHIAYTPLSIYLGRFSTGKAIELLCVQWIWVVILMLAAHWWWERATKKITIHGG